MTWGIFGALAFRALFIYLGTAALERWHWVEYVFGGLLLLAAVHAFREDPAHDRESKVVQWLGRHLPVVHDSRSFRFFVPNNGGWAVTPLFVAVLALELTDILFAIDSVPAAFAVTRDRFLIYSSNAFAILGLRSLYIVLAHTLERLRYLHYGLAGVLVFAAAKLVLGEHLPVTPLGSVLIIVGMIGAAALASLVSREPPVPRGPAPETPAPRELVWPTR